MIRRLGDSIRRLVGRRRFEREMAEELGAHLDHRIDDLVRGGYSRAEATRRARAEFGSIEGTKEAARAAVGVRWVDEVSGDLRYTIRTLRRSPGYALVAIATLALGIGANTAIFSVVDGVLLKSLPYPEPDRLVHLASDYTLSSLWTYRSDAVSYVSVAGYRSIGAVNLFAAERPERIQGRLVSSEFFSTLGVDAALGRTFRSGEDGPGAAPVAVISDALWRRRFGADPAILGQGILVEGTPREVVGVMPARFAFPAVGTEIWLPVVLDPKLHASVWGDPSTTLIGRLRAGVTVAQADAEHRALLPRIRDAFPWRMPDNYGQSPDNHVRPLDQVITAGVERRLTLLLAAVGLVLLVACVNVANLNLSRLAGRDREIAIRQAIGGTRLRVARQLVVEQLTVAAFGGAIGAGLAVVGTPLLIRWLPSDTPRLDQVAVDVGVLGFTALASVLAAVLTAVAPLLRIPGAARVDALLVGGKETRSAPSRGRMSAILVVTEVALAVVLVVGAAILLRSLRALLQVDPGVRTERIVTARVSPNPVWCKDQAGPCTCQPTGTCQAFFPTALDQLAAIPGVTAAAFANYLPLDGGQYQFPMDIEDHPVPAGQSAHLLGSHVVSGGYFAVMGIPILEGRPFASEDRADREPVAIVSRALAERYWRGRSALGKHVKPVWMPKPATIVGVVADVRYDRLEREHPSFDFYFPMAQWGEGQMTAVLRSALPAATLEPLLRSAIAAVDRTAPVSRVRAMDEVVRASTASPRTTTGLIGLFAAVAVLLGSIGIYGVLSYGVTQRRREIGIRMAVGARPNLVRAMIVGRAARLLGAGVVVGLTVAWLAASVLEGFVFGIGVRDPLSYAAVPILFAGIGLLASYLPARRATKVSPIEVLRAD